MTNHYFFFDIMGHDNNVIPGHLDYLWQFVGRIVNWCNISHYIKLLKEGEQTITLQTKYSQQVPTKSLLTVCKYCMNG